MPGIKESSIEDALTRLRQGRMIIVVDASDRENEGDFVCAAESITPEAVGFMLDVGRGVLCVPFPGETAERLKFTPMVPADQNTAPMQTPFMIPVDHVDTGTGVSTLSRARTIQAIANPRSRAEEFVRPGHINLLLAKPGGVLRRAGHTEATVDLMRLAGLQPVGTLIEILSRSGTGMADSTELTEISEQFDIPIISIESLIRYRRTRERLVHREVDTLLPTKYGPATICAYRVEHEDQVPLAIVFGDLHSVPAPLVRMHSSCFTGDLLASLRCDCGDQLHMALSQISEAGVGVLVYLPQEGRGIGLVPKLKAYVLQDQGFDTVEANHKLGFKADPRDYMVGLQILKDLGLSEIRLLTNNPKKIESLQVAMDLKVVEQIPLIAPHEPHRQHYLATKRDKMGHSLPPDAVQ